MTNMINFSSVFLLRNELCTTYNEIPNLATHPQIFIRIMEMVYGDHQYYTHNYIYNRYSINS